MPNMNPKKCPMPEQAPDVRNKNFDEVTLGYTAEMAVEEAQRCLNCKNKPCMTGCPVQVKIPEFIALVAEGKFLEAAAKIKETSALPAVCGRVCPQESQCECHCVRGIKGEPVAIGRLERFVADYARENSTEKAVKPESNGHKVAIVGAGPAGLTCAGDLARLGYEVTVFEALHTAGGVLMYGIPEFRLPKAIVQKEIDTLKDLGVEFVLNFVVGRSETIDELFGDGFEAIFVGSGAGLPTFIGVPGENANGVYSANEYLTRINLMKAYKENSDTPIYHAKKVAVVGGGNTAVTDALTLARIAKKVILIHRRDTLRASEIYHDTLMETDNVTFLPDTIVTALLADPPLSSAADRAGTAAPLQAGAVLDAAAASPAHPPRLSGIRVRNVKSGVEETLPLDGLFVSIGRKPVTALYKDQLALDASGYVVADETTATAIPGVYAVGDLRTKPLRQVITAAADGAVAAHMAEDYLTQKR